MGSLVWETTLHNLLKVPSNSMSGNCDLQQKLQARASVWVPSKKYSPGHYSLQKQYLDPHMSHEKQSFSQISPVGDNFGKYDM